MQIVWDYPESIESLLEENGIDGYEVTDTNVPFSVVFGQIPDTAVIMLDADGDMVKINPTLTPTSTIPILGLDYYIEISGEDMLVLQGSAFGQVFEEAIEDIESGIEELADLYSNETAGGAFAKDDAIIAYESHVAGLNAKDKAAALQIFHPEIENYDFQVQMISQMLLDIV